MKTRRQNSWLAALLAVTATYFYFLIFAEFAFLELATHVAHVSGGLETFMVALGSGGIAGAAFGARLADHGRGHRWLASAFRGCALAAMAALYARGLVAMTVAAFVVGVSLGALTVLLAMTLRPAVGAARLGLCIGAGTGLAYALGNLPPVFRAEPATQTLLAAVVAGAASFLPRHMSKSESAAGVPSESEPGALLRWLAILLALVWMDSAAFYIVQHTPALYAANWGDSIALFTNAIVHLVFAIVAGVLLDRGCRGLVATISISALALACFILNETVKMPASAGWFYTAGVSFYSVILVEYPARAARPWIAALIFGICGWLGSALGIGMAQDLARVPGSFVVVASMVVIAALLWRARSLRLSAITVMAGGALAADVHAADTAAFIAGGREVYIAEGCIHCHSQFVRPRTADDVSFWGPVKPLRETLAAGPPLIGTRRQGPDLSNVGNRRSSEWNRLHLIDPQSVSPGSRMPTYAYLFRTGDARGDALVAYLASLGENTSAARQAQIAGWTPDLQGSTSPQAARRLFAQLCSTCHGAGGRGDGPLASRLSIRPPDWTQMPFRRLAPNEDPDIGLSRIIKFGVPGLPMAGHEYLPDREVVALARYVQTLRSAAEQSAAGSSYENPDR